MDANPIGAVERLSTVGREGYERAALSHDECCRLLSVAGDRRCLYLMALRTGLRRSELYALEWADLDLDGQPSTVSVRAATTKDGKRAQYVLVPQLAAELREWRSKAPKHSKLVFGGSLLPSRGLGFFYVDLKGAGIPRVSDDGRRRVHFHSLRHSLCTEMGAKVSEFGELWR